MLSKSFSYFCQSFSYFRRTGNMTAARGNVREEIRREQDNSPTRQLTDTVFETIHRQILRQFTDTSEDNSPTRLFKVNDL